MKTQIILALGLAAAVFAGDSSLSVSSSKAQPLASSSSSARFDLWGPQVPSSSSSDPGVTTDSSVFTTSISSSSSEALEPTCNEREVFEARPEVYLHLVAPKHTCSYVTADDDDSTDQIGGIDDVDFWTPAAYLSATGVPEADFSDSCKKTKRCLLSKSDSTLSQTDSTSSSSSSSSFNSFTSSVSSDDDDSSSSDDDDSSSTSHSSKSSHDDDDDSSSDDDDDSSSSSDVDVEFRECAWAAHACALCRSCAHDFDPDRCFCVRTDNTNSIGAPAEGSCIAVAYDVVLTGTITGSAEDDCIVIAGAVTGAVDAGAGDDQVFIYDGGNLKSAGAALDTNAGDDTVIVKAGGVVNGIDLETAPAGTGNNRLYIEAGAYVTAAVTGGAGDDIVMNAGGIHDSGATVVVDLSAGDNTYYGFSGSSVDIIADDVGPAAPTGSISVALAAGSIVGQLDLENDGAQDFIGRFGGEIGAVGPTLIDRVNVDLRWFSGATQLGTALSVGTDGDGDITTTQALSGSFDVVIESGVEFDTAVASFKGVLDSSFVAHDNFRAVALTLVTLTSGNLLVDIGSNSHIADTLTANAIEALLFRVGEHAYGAIYNLDSVNEMNVLIGAEARIGSLDVNDGTNTAEDSLLRIEHGSVVDDIAVNGDRFSVELCCVHSSGTVTVVQDQATQATELPYTFIGGVSRLVDLDIDVGGVEDAATLHVEDGSTIVNLFVDSVDDGSLKSCTLQSALTNVLATCSGCPDCRASLDTA